MAGVKLHEKIIQFTPTNGTIIFSGSGSITTNASNNFYGFTKTRFEP